MTTSFRRPRRAVAAVLLAALAALVGFGHAGADPVTAPAVISREAYFTNPLTQVTPPLLRNGFPPATACLVAGLLMVPQVCGDQIQGLSSALGLSDGLPVLITPDGDLAQPIVVPGTTPVGMLLGQQRYASLLQLTLPTLPAGQRFSSFQLVLHQTGLNFAIESPATRDLVLQIFGQIENPNPQAVTDSLTRALTGATALTTDNVTGIEACPAVKPWQAGPAQGAGLDGVRVPEADCLIGTTGVHDVAAATWTFDLTFAAQAWTDGVDGKKIDNNGIVLRPVGAPNLAYGDPDLSTNWFVSLGDQAADAGARPTVRYSTEPSADAGGTTGADLTTGGDGSVAFPSIGSDSASDLGAISTPVDGSGPASVNGALQARYVAGSRHGGAGSTPGWVWLALPLGALAALLFGQSLSASPAAARRRPGALSRLVARAPHDLDPRS